MRHNVAGRLFGRTANQRKALLRGLVSSLIEHQRIETTLVKAKEARKVAERLVTLGVRGDLGAMRTAMAKLPDKDLVFKLFKEISPRFSGRNGGYLRIVRTRRRERDQAQMAVLEFVDYEELKQKSDEKSKGKPKQKAKKKEEKGGEKKEKKEARATKETKQKKQNKEKKQK